VILKKEQGTKGDQASGGTNGWKEVPHFKKKDEGNRWQKKERGRSKNRPCAYQDVPWQHEKRAVHALK